MTEHILLTEKFPSLRYYSFEEIEPIKNYTRCNPSIIQTNDGYRTIIRTVNYKIINDHDYIVDNAVFPDRCVHTENICVEWDKEWKVKSKVLIKDESNRVKWPVYVKGLEDMRQVNNLFGNDYMLSSCAESNQNGMPETVLIQWDPETATLMNVITVHPSFTDTKKKEKNWMPFIYDNKLCVIYEQHPLTIHSISNDGNYQVISKNDTIDIAKEFRGSTGPIKYNDGYLYLIHEVNYYPKWIYQHRFIYMDNEFKMKKISKLFSFIHIGIEFACGLCLSHNTDNYIITFGVRDGEAYRLEINKESIDLMLKIDV